MSYRNKAFAAAVLSFAALAPVSFASAADLPTKAVKPVADLPFFLIIDDRITFSYIFDGTDPGAFTKRPDGTYNGKTAKQGLFVHAFRCMGLRHQLLHDLDVQVGS